VSDGPRQTGRPSRGFNIDTVASGIRPVDTNLLRLPDATLWPRVKTIEQHYLLQQKHSISPAVKELARSLGQVPEMHVPALQEPPWLRGVQEIIRKHEGFLAQINTMVENFARSMAAPVAAITRMSQEFARPVNRFLDGLQPVLRDFALFMEDVEAGREVLAVSEFGFAEHSWNIFYIRKFGKVALIDERVRPMVVTNRLLAYTTSEEYVEELHDVVGGSKTMRKRWRIIESIWEAHSAKQYDLAVPATLAQIEGILVDLMIQKDLVKKENGKLYLASELETFQQSNDKKRKPRPVTLHPAVTNAKLDEHPNLAAASEFLANTLVSRRNNILHGHDLTYGKAKFSVQTLLILTVLAGGVSALESR
jgi:hypothetical protein